jgi:DNA-directed RNA polymerase subunit RPC12/RpoP
MSDDEDWIEDLIALGIGALAAYFLYKVITSNKKEDKIERCPYCGSEIKKWAIECPRCRRKIPGRSYNY